MEKIGSWLALRRYNWVDAFAFAFVSKAISDGNIFYGMVLSFPLVMLSFHLEARYRR